MVSACTTNDSCCPFWLGLANVRLGLVWMYQDCIVYEDANFRQAVVISLGRSWVADAGQVRKSLWYLKSTAFHSFLVGW